MATIQDLIDHGSYRGNITNRYGPYFKVLEYWYDGSKLYYKYEAGLWYRYNWNFHFSWSTDWEEKNSSGTIIGSGNIHTGSDRVEDYDTSSHMDWVYVTKTDTWQRSSSNDRIGRMSCSLSTGLGTSGKVNTDWFTIPKLVNDYTITYNANGGLGAPATHTKQDNNSIRIADAPYRVGYKFIEWNTSQDGTGTSYTCGQLYSAASNLTLYAQWEAEKTVDSINVSNSRQRYIPSKLLSLICTKIGQKFYGDVLYENNNTISWGTYVSDSSLWSSFTFLNNKKCSDYKRIVIKADTYHNTKIVIEILDPCPNKIFMFTDNFIHSDDAHTLYLRSIQYKFSNDGTGIELDGYRGQRTFKENTASAYSEYCYFCIRKIIGFKN